LLDENGAPRIHQIAWLVYSDVALFDLVYNRPLQEYLLEIAPYWIEQCDLDGVRIDASQTIDRPFLKKLKNRIQVTAPEALVLGETLCPLAEATDIPVDMVYALLVDFHRDVEHAGPFIDFLEETNRVLAPGTVAMAYFENHDSPRATRVWHERFRELLRRDAEARAHWGGYAVKPENRALLMALLKNLQAAVIDCSAGSISGCNLARGLEWGSEWGEETRSDFENETLLDFARAAHEPHTSLVRAYGRLWALQKTWPELVDGEIYFHRNEADGGNPDDRVLAYVRYAEGGALLIAHNLDPRAVRRVHYRFDYLPQTPALREKCFDTYAAFALETETAEGEFALCLMPLQTQVWRLY
jgi:glycosidase